MSQLWISFGHGEQCKWMMDDQKDEFSVIRVYTVVVPKGLKSKKSVSKIVIFDSEA